MVFVDSLSQSPFGLLTDWDKKNDVIIDYGSDKSRSPFGLLTDWASAAAGSSR